jgi:hypothetical protein
MIAVYNLLNPMFYLITPLLAIKYAEYIGLWQPASFLLPNIVNTGIFLTALLIGLLKLGPARRKTGALSAIAPLSRGALGSLVCVIILLGACGAVLFVGRNLVAFGAWNGSFSAEYAKGSARPQVPIFSAYGDAWAWAIQALSLTCLWQSNTRKWPAIVAFVPLTVGLIFTSVEGDRVLLGSAALTLAAWLGFRRRLRVRAVIGGVLLATLLTVAANARYNKAETNITERIHDMFRPEYFRPFWSSDPSGPATAATMVCARYSDPSGLTLGEAYARNLIAMIPRSIWPGRPDDATVSFAREYADMNGLEYYSGTGFAFNAVAEAFMNFWYFGALLLGVVNAAVCFRINERCVQKPGLIGRALFSLLAPVIAWDLARASAMVFLSPFMIIDLALIKWMLRRCSPRSARTTGKRAGLCARKSVPVQPVGIS